MRRILAIGGGELKLRETLMIDRYIAQQAKAAAGDRRACGRGLAEFIQIQRLH